jgi:hypothetical protein
MPESSTVNDVPDDNLSNWSTTVTSSSENFPTTRTKKSAPIATTVLADGSTDLVPTPPEAAAFIRFSLPLPTYTPHEPSIRDPTWSEGFAPAVPIYGPFFRRERRTERKETLGGVFIDYSVPSVPSYVHEPVAGGFSVHLESAHSNKGIGNTATMHHPETFSSVILQTAYKPKYTVSTDTSYTNPDVVDKILTQASHKYNFHLSTDNLSFANIASNAGPASWIKSDLNKPHPSDPKSGLQPSDTVESTKHTSDEAKVKQIQDEKALQDTFIPSTVPEEIQAIIDSYLSGRPLLLVISNKRFFDYWSLRLPKEFGFLMLGYFRILGVQVFL